LFEYSPNFSLFKGFIIVTFDTSILLSKAICFTFSSFPINTALANPSSSTSAAACITRTSSLSGNNMVLIFCLAFSFIVSTKDMFIPPYYYFTILLYKFLGKSTILFLRNVIKYAKFIIKLELNKGLILWK